MLVLLSMITSENSHARSKEQVLTDLDTSPTGLSAEEAKKRIQLSGLNRLPEPPKRSVLARFFIHFHNILIYVLLGSAFITALLGHFIDTTIILAVVIVNAIIGFIQEGKAEKAMEAIREMLAPSASVLRSGERHSVKGEELVPGDIVLLEAGDKVPADMRLLQTHGLQVQEAILTGESVPVTKHIKPVAEQAVLGDRACMTFSGTLVTSGQGKGIVVATGSKTEIGRISGMLSEVEILTTPLVRQMSIFAKQLTVVILAVAAVILLFGYFIQGRDFTELFIAIVGFSVAAIPEGLPTVLTVTLAIGVQAMARRNAIVRRLPAIETLGSVSVICTDKTGTLTRNEMTVVSVAINDRMFTIEGSGYEPVGEITLDGSAIVVEEYPALVELARAALLCNDAGLRMHEGAWRAEGDPMEAALLTFSSKVELDVEKEKIIWPRTDTIPFDSKHRYMATLHHDHKNHAFVYAKGAPEAILAMCHEQRDVNGKTEPLKSADWHAMAASIADRGQRVLAFAVKSVNPEQTVLEQSDIEGTLTLIGFVGLIDPPRPEAISAVAECHAAGIRVKMITGDHAGTAAAIGKQIGLQNSDKVITGAELDDMSDADLKATILKTDIFARTSPEHKLRLVMALQSHGMTVAMTGDGVNDAPALKRADTGIAMGKKGSEAAKEASELVLADDNFASIASAVREGRTVYDNLKKVISFILPINGGESLSLIIAILFGLTLPITAAQILWVNMGSSVALAMALAFEKPEATVMHRPPRQVNAPILSGLLIWRIIFVSVLFSVGVFGQFILASWQGNNVETARTMTVNTLVVMEIFYLFSVRYIHGTSLTLRGVLGTPAILLAVGAVTVLQFLFTYAPFMQTFFKTEALTIAQGLQVISFGVVVLFLIEIEKLVVRRLQK
jgi:potassium/sodium efflux P-type ATPase